MFKFHEIPPRNEVVIDFIKQGTKLWENKIYGVIDLILFVHYDTILWFRSIIIVD